MFPTKLKIVHVGNPILRQISTPFSKEEISSPTLKSLIKDMFLIMKEDDGVKTNFVLSGKKILISNFKIDRIGSTSNKYVKTIGSNRCRKFSNC